MKRQQITRLLLAIISLIIGFITASAQNLPSTVREQAASGQAPAGAVHAAKPQHNNVAYRPIPACPMQRTYGYLKNSPWHDILYSNGPTNGTNDADFIDAYVLTDSFVPTNGPTMTSFDVGLWTPSGAIPLTVDWSVGTTSFGSDIGRGSGPWTTLTLLCSNGQSYHGGVCGGGFGYDVYDANISVSNLSVTDGNTYWLTLTGATDSFGGRDAWDVNSGRSLAFYSQLGAVPSESFTINGSYGGGNACMPEQDGGFKVIYDFTGGSDGGDPSGVVIDRGGNLYGPSGGVYPYNGTVFKLAEAGSGWSLSTLYSFPAGINRSSPSGVILSPKGILYGAAQGGLQNCPMGFSEDCGLIFGLGPSPNIAQSNWGERTIYDFTSMTDAYWGKGLVSDEAGNLYGVSTAGGALQQGAVFELTPSRTSIGGWTESILYSFTGASDGGDPTTLVVGPDGNVYGMGGSGGLNSGGVIFQLTPSGSGWTESVLYNLPDSPPWSTSPRYLVRDSEGNLFGIYDQEYDSVVFMLAPSNGQWTYSELAHGNPYEGELYLNLTIDAAGNLYGTGRVGIGCPYVTFYPYIFKLTRTGDGWVYSTPVHWDSTDFFTSGALALDAQGNLYGTTETCGARNHGAVWELTP